MSDTAHHSDGPETPTSWELQNAFYAAGLAAIIVAVIYFGQPILMPVALAVLLAFALAPLVAWLKALGLGRIPSVGLTVLTAFVVIGALGTYIFSEVAHLASGMPRYTHNLELKINSIRSAALSNGLFAGAQAMLERLDNDLTAPTGHQPGTAAKPAQQPPLQVEIRPQDTPLRVVQTIVGPLLEPLATTGIVIIFVMFILLQKEDLRDRFIHLAGSHDLRRATIAIDDGASRLSRYLLMQTAINTSFGILIGTGLWLIGIPNAGLWGLVGAMFRFVPYVGVPVASVIPVAVAFAIDPSWMPMVLTASLYLVIEFSLGQFVEPYVYGRSIGLSATAIIVAATFWTWVWGPVGLLLSTPLTMCLVVLGRHVDQLRFLDVLLGDRPPLALEEGLYLRMLEGDPDEAAHQAEKFLASNSLSAYFDEVVIKALVLAQADARHGTLDRDRRHSIHMAIEGLLQNLSERGDDGSASDEPENQVKSTEAAANAENWADDAVLCVAGPGPLDDVAALLLVDLLGKHRIGAHVVLHSEVLPANIDRLQKKGIKLIAVCYLEPANFTNARYLVRRLNRRFPQTRILLNFWGANADDSRYLDAIEATGCELIATTIRESQERVLYFAKHAQGDEHHVPHHHGEGKDKVHAAE